MKRLLVLVLAAAACTGSPKPESPIAQLPTAATDAAPAIAALQASKFDEARSIASQVMQKDGGNSRAAAVRALVTYQAAGHALITRLTALAEQGDDLKFLDHEAGRQMWKTFLDGLDAVDRDLAIAAADPAFSLELCLACWEHDWNRTGEVDERDRKLFEIEYDGKGGEIPEGTPARRPTFRFDVGDIDWARAMISFQRAGVQLVLAYQWSELDKLFERRFTERKLTIKLTDPGRVKKARELILDGVAYADRCRAAYLAETDDDREWVPNPRQQNHPVPLPMDAAIYDTWAGVTGDVRRMLTSEEGLSLKQVVALVEPKAATLVPDAYLDFGAMLRDPRDIVLDLTDSSESPANVERILRGVFGNGYRTGMKASPLVQRLGRMKADLDRGTESFDHKLRYLLWLN
ncbi:MAG: hypothetical protein H0T46_32885 [Deltaproteobacteria bacterium]|nr:hypothetical protein [Deltaproteobacteria bacterium]